MKKLITIITIFTATSCGQTIDTNYIRQHGWKIGDGEGWVGDWISFETNLYKISGDTLYKRDTARAVIISLDKAGYNGDNEMVIKRIKDNSKATYHEK